MYRIKVKDVRDSSIKTFEYTNKTVADVALSMMETSGFFVPVSDTSLDTREGFVQTGNGRGNPTKVRITYNTVSAKPAVQEETEDTSDENDVVKRTNIKVNRRHKCG